MPDGQDQDPTAPAPLWVTLTDSSGNPLTDSSGNPIKLSLADYLKQADDAMAQADSIQADAIVMVTDGQGNTQTMTGAQYQQLVEQDQQQAHAYAGQQLDSFTASMTLCVETFSGLAGHLSDHAAAVSGLLADLQVSLRGIHAAIGTDDKSQTFRTNWDPLCSNVQANMRALSASVSNIHDGMNKSADDTFACEKNTLVGFGRQAVDPRTSPGGH